MTCQEKLDLIEFYERKITEYERSLRVDYTDHYRHLVDKYIDRVRELKLSK